jgi:hypothetical protein
MAEKNAQREEAIYLANRYKDLEKQISQASTAHIESLRHEAAQIASKMYALGYSLPQLIRKRQIRKESHDNSN